MNRGQAKQADILSALEILTRQATLLTLPLQVYPADCGFIADKIGQKRHVHARVENLARVTLLSAFVNSGYDVTYTTAEMTNMHNYTSHQVDAFTTTRCKGTPAGVVLAADGLSEQQMLAIARELNNSETAFLFQPDCDRCDGVIRYFTPTIEVPICGHATIGAMYAKAVEERLGSCVLSMKTGVGILPFVFIRKPDSSFKLETLIDSLS